MEIKFLAQQPHQTRNAYHESARVNPTSRLLCAGDRGRKERRMKLKKQTEIMKARRQIVAVVEVVGLGSVGSFASSIASSALLSLTILPSSQCFGRSICDIGNR